MILSPFTLNSYSFCISTPIESQPSDLIKVFLWGFGCCVVPFPTYARGVLERRFFFNVSFCPLRWFWQVTFIILRGNRLVTYSLNERDFWSRIGCFSYVTACVMFGMSCVHGWKFCKGLNQTNKLYVWVPSCLKIFLTCQELIEIKLALDEPW